MHAPLARVTGSRRATSNEEQPRGVRLQGAQRCTSARGLVAPPGTSWENFGGPIF